MTTAKPPPSYTTCRDTTETRAWRCAGWAKKKSALDGIKRAQILRLACAAFSARGVRQSESRTRMGRVQLLTAISRIGSRRHPAHRRSGHPARAALQPPPRRTDAPRRQRSPENWPKDKTKFFRNNPIGTVFTASTRICFMGLMQGAVAGCAPLALRDDHEPILLSHPKGQEQTADTSHGVPIAKVRR